MLHILKTTEIVRSLHPYNCVHTVTFLVIPMMAYQAETCCWMNNGLHRCCVWLHLLCFWLQIQN